MCSRMVKAAFAFHVGLLPSVSLERGVQHGLCTACEAWVLPRTSPIVCSGRGTSTPHMKVIYKDGNDEPCTQ